ncbi:hypothetical protein [Caulobacter sp. 17J65-9]|uniref:hypothetical protein n=1 Tax=Caulobacter sp. 17J65-9 TaxID=2709382 RepID=UPI0013CC3D6A|nr:hypothetical protein [Caulobacter sp. 17J65-9]NEX94168.1 hypothetical protein [Caulobacter sp. 17J65-9]
MLKLLFGFRGELGRRAFFAGCAIVAAATAALASAAHPGSRLYALAIAAWPLAALLAKRLRSLGIDPLRGVGVVIAMELTGLAAHVAASGVGGSMATELTVANAGVFLCLCLWPSETTVPARAPGA